MFRNIEKRLAMRLGGNSPEQSSGGTASEVRHGNSKMMGLGKE
jgi:hypothetical protein